MRDGDIPGHGGKMSCSQANLQSHHLYTVRVMGTERANCLTPPVLQKRGSISDVTVGLLKDDFCFGEHGYSNGQTPLASCLQTKCIFITVLSSLTSFILICEDRRSPYSPNKPFPSTRDRTILFHWFFTCLSWHCLCLQHGNLCLCL